MFQCFPLPESAFGSSFLVISLPFLLGFQKILLPLNSANFYMYDRMDEMNFWNPSFSVLCSRVIVEF